LIAAVQRLPAELAFVVFTRAAVVAALVILLAIASPHFLTSDNIVILLRQAALQFLLSAGLTLVVLTGGIDLSVGAVLGLSACLGAALIAKGLVVAGVAAALVVGLACGVANGALVAYVGIPAFIATYGMLWVAHGLGYVFMKGEVIHGFAPGFRSLGAGFLAGIPLPVLRRGRADPRPGGERHEHAQHSHFLAGVRHGRDRHSCGTG
jgi:ribose transport system permease protein